MLDFSLIRLVLYQLRPILDVLDIIEDFRTNFFKTRVKYHKAKLPEMNDKCLGT